MVIVNYPQGGIKIYKITYVTNGGSPEPSPNPDKKKKNRRYYISSTEPSKEDYTFTDWLGSDLNTYKYGDPNRSYYDGNANLILSAEWKELPVLHGITYTGNWYFSGWLESRLDSNHNMINLGQDFNSTAVQTELNTYHDLCVVLTTNGRLTFLHPGVIDVFIVGGGGAGGYSQRICLPEQEIDSYTSTNGGNGSASSFDSISAAGGKGGYGERGNNSSGNANGGDGGSGGGAANISNVGNGGSNSSDGGTVNTEEGATKGIGGKGLHDITSNTRAFSETSNLGSLFSSGGYGENSNCTYSYISKYKVYEYYPSSLHGSVGDYSYNIQNSGSGGLPDAYTYGRLFGSDRATATGGGGGYTTTQKGISVSKNSGHDVIIGAGGENSSNTSCNGKNGVVLVRISTNPPAPKIAWYRYNATVLREEIIAKYLGSQYTDLDEFLNTELSISRMLMWEEDYIILNNNIGKYLIDYDPEYPPSYTLINKSDIVSHYKKPGQLEFSFFDNGGDFNNPFDSLDTSFWTFDDYESKTDWQFSKKYLTGKTVVVPDKSTKVGPIYDYENAHIEDKYEDGYVWYKNPLS